MLQTQNSALSNEQRGTVLVPKDVIPREVVYTSMTMKI